MHAAENPLKVDQYKSMVTSFGLLETLSSQIKDPLIYVQLYWEGHLIKIQDPRNQDTKSSKIRSRY